MTAEGGEKRLYVKRVLSFIAGAAVVAGAFMVWFHRSETTLKDILAEDGYLELVPPSEFHGPGTLNTVEAFEDGSIRLLPTCEIDQALLSARRRESRTHDQEFEERLSGSFDVKAELAQKLQAASNSGLNLGAIKSITVRLENTKILTMSDEALFSLRNDLLVNNCAAAVSINLGAGGLVCQSQSVLQTDMIYEVVLEEQVSAEQKMQILRDVSGALELDLAREGSNRIQGKSLFYGVKLNRHGVFKPGPDAIPVECPIAQ